MIKKFIGKDKEEVYHLIKPLNDKYYYPVNLKRSNVLFVAFEDNKVVAFLGMNQRNGYWYFRGCYVLSEYRGKGYQVKLMKSGFKELKDRDVNRISSLVHVDNKISLNNALKVGFEVTGRRKENYHIVKYFKDVR